ncbi:MAG: SDR family NAD(P)-dependent oxidoreductase, partial [Chloroflexota bacterium]
MRLENKAAIITGGAGAMGSAQGRLFAREGAAVCLADLDGAKAQAVAGEIEADGGRAIGVSLDVRDRARWEEAVP